MIIYCLFQSNNTEDILIIVFCTYINAKMYRLLDYGETGRYLKL